MKEPRKYYLGKHASLDLNKAQITLNLVSDEVEDDDDDSNLSYLPEEERDVFIERSQLSIFELHRRIKRGDIILQPVYQRKGVWTKPKKSKLIESVLRNIPIPSIYFAETPDNRWEVVDGQQRLATFFDFIDNKYELSKLPVLTHFEKHFFNELGAYQRKIEDYQLHVFIIKKESHPDIKFDIFERINEGATKLNAQELRNSMYRGPRIDILKSLSKNPDFIRVTKGLLQTRRQKDVETILRFISFYLKSKEKYNGSLNSFLNDTLERNLINTENELELNNAISHTMKGIYLVFGDKAFILEGNVTRMNMSLFDILTYSFSNYDHETLINFKDSIKNALRTLITDNIEFNNSLTSNTLTKKNVNLRFDIWLNTMKQIIGS